MNFPEELVSEWYSYRGYYVLTNVRVGKREAGGYEGELDVVAFHPEAREIIRIETPMDAKAWSRRRERFARKLDLGQQYIPRLFKFTKQRPNQVVVAGFPRATRDDQPPGADVEAYLTRRLIGEIAEESSRTTVESGVITETSPLLRAMPFALDYGGYLKAT